MTPRRYLLGFAPALLLGLGVVSTLGVNQQRAMPLRTPLDSVIPRTIGSYTGRDVLLSTNEEAVAGMDDYLMRNYASDTHLGFSLYVGYYERQMRGRTIHSPKNCLPGGGWDALASGEIQIKTLVGTARVNRYLLQKGRERALVLYWYQGRGRVAWNEYMVKWDLLRDAAVSRRTEEALVRVVVPVIGDQDAALDVATATAQQLIPAVAEALPAWR